MAHLLRVSVIGLAGRDTNLALTFNSDINVIFGLNGSGKTSLLKIIHSALTNDASTLLEVPFTHAEVEFAIPGRAITRKIAKSDPASQTRLFPDMGPHETAERRRARRALEWQTTPPEYSDDTFSHRYLPTSRLFATPDYYSYYPRSEVSEDVVALERRLDTLFARFLPQLWNSYFTTLLRQVRGVQANGLASVLRSILTTDKWDETFTPTTPFEVAYKRVQTFMSRQGSEYLIRNTEEFRSKYKNDARVRRIVSDLNDVEAKIEETMIPRDQLQTLVAELFSGPKEVRFEDDEVHVRTPSSPDIGLATLSSGEKHLLRILIESLLAQDGPMMVDEPELSMHVDWQRRLIPALAQLNPAAQLVLATHSPEIMADIADSKLFRLWPD